MRSWSSARLKYYSTTWFMQGAHEILGLPRNESVKAENDIFQRCSLPRSRPHGTNRQSRLHPHVQSCLFSIKVRSAYRAIRTQNIGSKHLNNHNNKLAALAVSFEHVCYKRKRYVIILDIYKNKKTRLCSFFKP